MAFSQHGKLTGLKKSPYGAEEYDSALEREYMVELERDPAVRSWTKRHGIKIGYTFLGFPRRYLPDFLVEYQDGHKELHETKGLPLLFWLSTKLKRVSAEEYCRRQGWRYKLITKGRQAFYSSACVMLVCALYGGPLHIAASLQQKVKSPTREATIPRSVEVRPPPELPHDDRSPGFEIRVVYASTATIYAHLIDDNLKILQNAKN